MQFLRKHWLAILAIFPNLPWIWIQVVRLFDWGARFDLTIAKLHEAGGVSGLIAFLLNPPAWSIWVTVIGGLLLIYWDTRRQRAAGTISPTHGIVAANRASIAPVVQSTPPIEPVVKAPVVEPPIARSHPATPLPPATPEKPPRNFVDVHVTPEFLVGLYEGNTALRAETLVSEQLGKWMRVSGPLGEIHPGMVMSNRERSSSLVVFASHTKPIVYMWFSGEWIDRLALLPKNQNISVVGKIKKVVDYNATVELENCELLDSNPTGNDKK